MRRGLDRREFLKAGAAAGVCAAAAPAWGAVGNREAMRELPYGAVQLTGGPLAEQYAWVKAHYLGLSDDDLLHGYRAQAGLRAPGVELGGWYATDGFVPGHSWGQYVSGLARMGATTGDARCAEKVRALVSGFAETLGKQNQSILRPETNLWKCYTLDKHFAGLLDAGELTGVKSAREVMVRVLEGAQGWLPKVGRDRVGKKNPPYDETYVMPENLFAAQAATGDSRFGELARRYMLDEFFDPLARGEDVLPGKHAYSHAIALSSAGKAWVDGGDAKYLRTMANAWEFLTAEQQFASGGWGPNEQFVETGRGLRFAALTSTVDHFETPCGAYAATKLARYLLRATGEAKYGDNLERVVWNTVLGVKRPDGAGDYPYYSTYSNGAVKTFYQAKWPCCSGTLVQTVAEYVKDLYFATHDGVVVNLFAPSTVQWMQDGQRVEMVQETEYPLGETVRLRMKVAKPQRFAVRLRVPGWARGASVAVNGVSTLKVAPGEFVTMHKLWRDGDRVELKLPQVVRVEAIDAQHPQVVAVMRGAVMYVALGDAPEGAMRLPEGLVEEGEGLRLGDVRFVPFYRVMDERYSTYVTRA